MYKYKYIYLITITILRIFAKGLHICFSLGPLYAYIYGPNQNITMSVEGLNFQHHRCMYREREKQSCEHTHRKKYGCKESWEKNRLRKNRDMFMMIVYYEADSLNYDADED